MGASWATGEPLDEFEANDARDRLDPVCVAVWGFMIVFGVAFWAGVIWGACRLLAD